MRSSSRRLKVTALAGAGARSSPPRHALGSISPISIRRLLCHVRFMIAPDGGGGKRLLHGKWRGLAARKRGGRPPLPMVTAHGRGTAATFATAGITASLGES